MVAAIEFWEFSVDLYGREGVAQRCLQLQDDYGVNVNLLLLCCWQGAQRGQIFDDAALEHLHSATAVWHGSVVQPLRDVRRGVQPGLARGAAHRVTNLRKMLLQAELDAERIEQEILCATLAELELDEDPAQHRLRATVLSLAAYCRIWSGAPPDTAAHNAIAAILTQLFPDGGDLSGTLKQYLPSA